MRYRTLLKSVLAVVVVSAAGVATADESIGIGSARFTTTVEVRVADKPVKMTLTGVAMRKKAFFSVYAVASYLQSGVTARTAEQLAAADGVKLMHLIMERDVSGRDMAEAIAAGVKLNHPADAFGGEIKKVSQVLGAMDLRRGDHVMLTSIPDVGLRCQVAGKADAMIESPAFARAVWDIYLGRNNLGDSVKVGLVSRL